jgi:hypothetical protein
VCDDGAGLFTGAASLIFIDELMIRLEHKTPLVSVNTA